MRLNLSYALDDGCCFAFDLAKNPEYHHAHIHPIIHTVAANVNWVTCGRGRGVMLLVDRDVPDVIVVYYCQTKSAGKRCGTCQDLDG